MIFQLRNDNTLPQGEAARYVLGQTDFNSSTAGLANNQLTKPAGMVFDEVNDRLFVSSTGGVYVYDLSGGITTGMAATYLLGYPGFGYSGCSFGYSNTCILDAQGGLALDSDDNLLFVGDPGNNRIMIYNVAPDTIATHEAAVHELGQPHFSDGEVYNTTQAEFKHFYSGLAYDSVHERLFVSDQLANRILVFDLENGITNGMPASNVLEQDNFSDDAAGTSQTTLSSPYGLAYDDSGNQLFVDDTNNDRIMVFNLSNGITDGMPASGVLGQVDFDTGTFFNTTSQTHYQGGYTSNMYFDDSTRSLYFGSYYDNRIVAYSFATFETSSLPLANAGSPYNQTLQVSGSNGQVAYSLVSGQLPPGLNLNADTGVISGTPSNIGTYSFEIGATDDNGSIGSFYDDPSYTITVNPAVNLTVNPTVNPTVHPTAPNTGYGTAENSSLMYVFLFSGTGILLVVVVFRRRAI
jgi:sugar lactone lactonase YvrE